MPWRALTSTAARASVTSGRPSRSAGARIAVEPASLSPRGPDQIGDEPRPGAEEDVVAEHAARIDEVDLGRVGHRVARAARWRQAPVRDAPGRGGCRDLARGAGQADEARPERVHVLLDRGGRVAVRVDRDEEDRDRAAGEPGRVAQVGQHRGADVRAVRAAGVHERRLASQPARVERPTVLVGQAKGRGGPRRPAGRVAGCRQTRAATSGRRRSSSMAPPTARRWAARPRRASRRASRLLRSAHTLRGRSPACAAMAARPIRRPSRRRNPSPTAPRSPAACPRRGRAPAAGRARRGAACAGEPGSGSPRRARRRR